MQTAFKETLIALLKKHAPTHGQIEALVEKDADLMQSGLVDSFGFLELTMQLEEAFGVSIDFSQTPPDALTRPSQLEAYFAP